MVNSVKYNLREFKKSCQLFTEHSFSDENRSFKYLGGFIYTLAKEVLSTLVCIFHLTVSLNIVFQLISC
jgi:hypothetical protein